MCPDTIIYASSYYYMLYTQAHVGLHLAHSAVARRCPNDTLDGGGARFTCFTGTKVQFLTQNKLAASGGCALLQNRYYDPRKSPRAGTQFTCFTSTKVQILTPEELFLSFRAPVRSSRQRMARALSVYSVYLLYWYKRTNTNAARRSSSSLCGFL
jgi:hypothetical protein